MLVFKQYLFDVRHEIQAYEVYNGIQSLIRTSLSVEISTEPRISALSKRTSTKSVTLFPTPFAYLSTNCQRCHFTACVLAVNLHGAWATLFVANTTSSLTRKCRSHVTRERAKKGNNKKG